MKLSDLLNGLEIIEWNVDRNIQIDGICTMSEKAKSGDMFICLNGTRVDGHGFVERLKNTVSCFLVERPVNAPYVLVKDTRKAYSIACQNYFGNPAKDMKFVSIVGTNGKTSTAHILSSLLKTAGMTVGTIGTIGHFVGDEKIGESLTTPDPYELNKLLQLMRTRAVEVVVAEVSAHAVYFDKLYGIDSDLAVFTNVTQDHLDFFKTFEEYANVKLSFFGKNVKAAVVNVDDAYGRKLALNSNIPVITYGLYEPSDVFAIDVYPDFDGTSFVANMFDEVFEMKSPLYRVFNVYNLLAAMICCSSLGVDVETIKRGVRRLKPIDGRFNVLKNGKGFIVIDYAHTPDGLDNLLRTARTITKSRLITVFGCGGDRDVSKRKIMGKIASELSDAVILTSDNPRSENPEKIIADIECGAVKPSKTIVNRAEAIAFALNEMAEGDTVVIAGKGAENYMEIKGKKIPYSDLETVLKRGAKR